MIISIGFKRDDNDSGVIYDVLVPEQTRLDSDRIEAMLTAADSLCLDVAEYVKNGLGKGAKVTKREHNSTTL